MTNILVPKLFGFAKIFRFSFSAHHFSVGRDIVKSIKYKENLLFLVNTKYISSRELQTSEFSLVLRTRENSDVFNTLDEIYLLFSSKK